MPYYRPGTGWGFFIVSQILHGLLVLGLLVLIVVLCVWAIRHLTSDRRVPPPYRPMDAAEQELRRRYAAGEVGRDEYLMRMADLRGHVAPQGPPPPQAPPQAPPEQPPQQQ